METTQSGTQVSQNRFVIFKRSEPLDGEIMGCRHVNGASLAEIRKKLYPTEGAIESVIDATTWSVDRVTAFMIEAEENAGKEAAHV